MGLLPVIAKGVDVSIPAAGMLISAYAIGVMVGAPLMTLLLSSRAQKCADFSDGDLYAGEHSLLNGAGLHHAADFAHYHQS